MRKEFGRRRPGLVFIPFRHSREGGNPLRQSYWIAAFAGMTLRIWHSFVQTVSCNQQ
jgi:hypothetical protein